MNIIYTEEKLFTMEQVRDLFLSVGWISGNYPQRLFKALSNSSTVLTAWHSNQLVGLVRVLDDSEMMAYIHYVLVHPDFQGRKIASTMMEAIKETYKDFLYLEVMPEESKNVPFYERFGFQKMADGTPMQLCNFK